MKETNALQTIVLDENSTDGSIFNSRSNQIKKLIGSFNDVFRFGDCGCVVSLSTEIMYDWHISIGGTVEIVKSV